MLVMWAGQAGAQVTRTSARVHTATINGAQIADRDLNRSAIGVPLVMITGYGSTMAEWDPRLVARLAQHRRVVLLDNRGIGRSTGSLHGLTIRRMANDAAGLIHALRLHRVDVLGWSMGGFIAQELALDSPRLVRRLILASTDPGSPHTVTGSPSVATTAAAQKAATTTGWLAANQGTYMRLPQLSALTLVATGRGT